MGTHQAAQPLERNRVNHLAILGSTGSIGRQCLSVVESLPGQFVVCGLAAGSNLDELVKQIERHRPNVVSVADGKKADELVERLRAKNLAPLPAIHHGRAGMVTVATLARPEIVVSAAVGVVGLEATYEAVKLGKIVALSNKEVLVAAGELVMAAAQKVGRELLPVDSEHNAVHQCLRGGKAIEVRRLVLTASGGPFRKTRLSDFDSITPEQALAHPNWRMGNRISIDSATMMNKGFEIIEARWLFGMHPDQIDVVIHPQSVVHSMVEFVDGSIKAQLGVPDMHLPIAVALSYPERLEGVTPAPDLAALGQLSFEPLDEVRYPAVALAREAGERGGTAPAVLNAANEEAVALFLAGQRRFVDIIPSVRAAVEAAPASEELTLEAAIAADRWARAHVRASAGGASRLRSKLPA